MKRTVTLLFAAFILFGTSRCDESDVIDDEFDDNDYDVSGDELLMGSVVRFDFDFILGADND